MTAYQNSFFQNKSLEEEFPYRAIIKRDLPQLRHNPHPLYVRHVKGFLGQPTQIVETDEDNVILSQGTVEGFIQDSVKRGVWNYMDSKSFVRKTRDLDEILSLQYFTGLQNFSFKENYLPYLGYREYFSSWRKNLRNLSINSYQFIKDKTKTKNENKFTRVENSNEWNKTNSDIFRRKSMYSSSGRLSVYQDRDRKSSFRERIRSQQRISTGISYKSNEKDEDPDFNNFDASVFVLIANLLQTTSPHVVQNWLSQSTDREKAIMISMIQNVLLNQNSNNLSNGDMQTEKETQTSKCNMTAESALRDIKNNSKNGKSAEDKCDILVIDRKLTGESVEDNPNDFRPPTSSTFRPVKTSDRSSSKASKLSSKATMWSQGESLNSLN